MKRGHIHLVKRHQHAHGNGVTASLLLHRTVGQLQVRASGAVVDEVVGREDRRGVPRAGKRMTIGERGRVEQRGEQSCKRQAKGGSALIAERWQE